MGIRALWLAVPACAAAGVVGVSVISAQESRVIAQPGALKPSTPMPDTRAATGMFGPPPPVVVAQSGGVQPPAVLNGKPVPDTRAAQNTFGPPNAGNTGIRPVSGNEPVNPPPLFFPDAPPPPALPSKPVKVEVPPPATLPPPKITVESSEPKPLPITPLPTIPAPVKATTGPQPLVPVAPVPVPTITTPPAVSTPPVLSTPPAMTTPPLTTTTGQPFPNQTLSAKNAPLVTIECIAPETVGVGQSCEYTLVVKNTGGAVNNVRIDDEIPTGAKYISSEPAAEQMGDRLSWNLGLLDTNSERRIRITVKPGDEGELRSRAMVSFTAAAEARVKVTRPRIGVTLIGMDSARVGDEVPFQIKVTNTGSGPATNLVVKATLSEGLQHPAGSQIEAMVDKLAAGESKTITLRATAMKAGANACNITAILEGLQPELAASNVSVVEPMLNAKVAGPAKCLVRSEPEYRVELTNPGSAATDPVQVWAMVPEGFEFLNTSDSGQFQPANRLVVWNVPALAAGTNRTLTLKLKAVSSFEGSLKVVAQSVPANETGVVTAGVKPAGSRIIEAKSETVVKAEGVPGLRFEVTDVEDPVQVGQDAIYDIKVVNQGTANCTNVVVVCTLAEGTSAAGANGPTTARGQGQIVTFDPMPSLGLKGEAIYRVKVRGGAAGDLKFKVAVSCDEIRTPTVKEENTRFFKD